MIPLKTSVLGAGMLLLSVGGALADSAVVSATNLNLRAGPDGHFATIAVMPRGATVTILKCDGEWCRVRYERAVGFASRAHLDVGAASFAAAGTDAATPATPSDPGARIWRWDDPRARDRIMQNTQRQRGHH